MATQICKSLDRNCPNIPPESKREIEIQKPNPVEGQVPIIVVDQMNRGDYATISQAIAAAKPGTKILVKPGVYDEGLTIDKPLEIVGDGDLGTVIVRAKGKGAIIFGAAKGKVSNMALKQIGEGKWYGVDISQGCLELETCDITSDSLACVAIYGDAYTILRENTIHDGKSAGVYVYEKGQGVIENNEIFGNALAGVAIKEGCNPTIRGNKIHDGKGGGIMVWSNGQCLIEEIDIFGNALTGVEIKEGGNPTIQDNKIHDGKASGIFVHDNGQGIIKDNDIFGNAKAGIVISEAGNPIVRSNRINKNGYASIWIYEKGAGTIEDNDLRENKKGAWDISKDSMDLVKRARNLE